ncbi:teichoic acid ABC transporter ATP-binding protein [Brachybacterium sp. P6-10-X1]|uniref:ABC transporter ATP-binding protein n=1 Tax=Brachybacterium sp. P6-10-X1 TaxID=1903186 RepID=UPI000971B3F7|nr:ABC transporter ATP-binding protein [Brachybacterium sp. P6-10-X1]APX32948.1 teichoic acid ABC transporter ATP-binding protein [Brachybacterium sp. P6-10-X1]
MTDTHDEIDFEIDPEDLDQAPPEEIPSDQLSLLVNDLHVSYRVFGAKKVGHGPGRKSGLLGRLARRGAADPPVREVKAIKGISFAARHGEAIGIIGVNGSGKSTLLRAIAGLVPPAGGTVHVASNPSLLGVNAVLMKDLTGERNIMIGALANGLTLEETRAKYQEIVDFAEIGDFVNLPMKSYSSGMGARLRFAISASAVPDILMIDEALATGDAHFRAKSKARMDEIRQSAGTVFLVSHSLATVQSMCTRVLWVHEGRLVMDGDSREVCQTYKEYVHARNAQRKRSAAKAAKAGKEG